MHKCHRVSFSFNIARCAVSSCSSRLMWANRKRCKGIFTMDLRNFLLDSWICWWRNKNIIDNFGKCSEFEVKLPPKLVFSTATEKLNQMTFGVMLTLHTIWQSISMYERMSIDFVLFNPMLLFALQSRRIKHRIDFGIRPPNSYLLQDNAINT